MKKFICVLCALCVLLGAATLPAGAISFSNNVVTRSKSILMVNRDIGQVVFEQDADAILMVWRPYPDSEEITDRYLRIAKNKDGAAGGKIDLHFDGKTQRFWTADPRSLMQRIREAASPRRQEPPEPQVQQIFQFTPPRRGATVLFTTQQSSPHHFIVQSDSN